MTPSGRSFDPGRPPSFTGPMVDYSLAKRSVLSSLRRGAVNTTDVCDAHPELLRAAKNIGADSGDRCPVCSHESLRQVRYVYGDELKRDNGRVVYPPGWLSELARSHDQFTCYVVECCVDCAWNHLVRSYMTGRRFAGARGAGGSAAERKQRG